MRTYGIGSAQGEFVWGLDHLLAKLRHLSKKSTRSSIARISLSKAVQPIQVAAKRNLTMNQSIETGLLRLAIGRRIRVYTGTGTVLAIVGPRTGFRRVGRKKVMLRGLGRKMVQFGKKGRLRIPSKYAHLVEKGTRPHATGKGSRHPANVRGKEKPLQIPPMHPGARAKPFIKPAWDHNRQGALATLASELGTRILQAANTA